MPNRSDARSTNTSDADEKRARLRQLLEARIRAGETPESSTPNHPTSQPLSVGQRALWFQQNLDPGSATYNIAAFWVMPHGTTFARTRQALQQVVQRHPPLRSTFSMDEGEPVQQIHAAESIEVARVDANGWTAEQFLHHMQEYTSTPFELASGPLVQAYLYEHDVVGSHLLLVLHHIVGDAISIENIGNELRALVQASVNQTKADLPELTVAYADYVEHQRSKLDGEEGEKLWTYWRDQFPNGLPTLDLRSERTGNASGRAVHAFSWSDGIHRRVEAFQKEAGTTSYVIFLAAFSILLQRYTRQSYIPVGTAAHGRTRPEYQHLVGYFVNPVLLGLDLASASSFRECVRHVEDVVWGAMDHQEYPFPTLVKRLRGKNQSDTPGFQVLFMHQHRSALKSFGGGTQTTKKEEAPAEDVIQFERELYQAKMQRGGEALLFLNLTATDHFVMGGFAYDTATFSPETIVEFEKSLYVLLDTLLTSPDQSLADVGLMSSDERQKFIASVQRRKVELVKPSCVHTLFEEQVARAPDAVALEHRGKRWTYAELDAWANQVCQIVAENLKGESRHVMLAMDRSPELIAAMIGVLKAGCSYVPVDIKQPVERITWTLQDADISLMFTTRDQSPDIDGEIDTVFMEDLKAAASAQLRQPGRTEKEDTERPAYVLYTSGSTGTPKGALIPHRAIVHLVRGVEYAPIRAGERVAHASNPAFDAATFEVWGALLNGATLVILDSDVVMDPLQLAPTLKQLGIKTAFLTTSLFNLMAERVPDAFHSLDRVIMGGERADPESIRRVLKHSPPAALINGYGPTECTTFAAWYAIEAVSEYETAIPIGGPVANTELYVLDAYGHPLPDGFPGELYIGGAGVAHGYLNREKLTRDAFLPSPFHEHKESGKKPLLYKTGDLVRREADGNLVFLDRIDRQVKIRGFRIEPAEIEGVLAKHPMLVRNVIGISEPTSTERQLVAFYVLKDGAEVDSQELRRYCAERLPHFMVPARFVAITTIPLTPNGKVDHSALLRLAFSQVRETKAYEAPEDEIESQLVRLYEELLGVEDLGRDAHFFLHGGHSLLAARLVARIEEEMDITVPLRTVFSTPVVADMADAIRGEDGQEQHDHVVAMQSGGTRLPLFLIPGAGGGPARYFSLKEFLGEEQPFYVLEGKGRDGREHPHWKLDQMVDFAIAAMKQVQPSGPYRLAGYSAGGLLAFEVANVLKRRGEEIEFLGLLDTCLPAIFLEEDPEEAERPYLLKVIVYSLRRGKEMFRFLGASLKWYLEFIRNGTQGKGVPLDIVSEYMKHLMKRAYWRHQPGVLEEHVTLFRTNTYPSHFPKDLGWSRIVRGEIGVEVFNCSHHDLIEDPANVQDVAAAMRRHMNAEHARQAMS